MQLTPKTKGIIAVIIFIIILILPATFGLIRAYFGKTYVVKQTDTLPKPAMK